MGSDHEIRVALYFPLYLFMKFIPPGLLRYTSLPTKKSIGWMLAAVLPVVLHHKPEYIHTCVCIYIYI